ncbi:hypothetical protein LDENG_00129240 [Lucifuga dentata]|nr:hypothetical protein LDENG_00129240 [Lucifuga dentata]
MPPKKPATNSAGSSSSDAPQEDEKTDAATLRKVSTHPSTMTMVKEALAELDSRKGASSLAIQRYIKNKYPSVDLLRLKYLVRKALIKGVDNGTVVRPANSTVTTGAQGRFRLAPKKPKTKTENAGPDGQKLPKATDDGARKPNKTGASKEKDAANKPKKSAEGSKPPKKVKTDDPAGAAPKAAPAKKPKAKKAADDEGAQGASSSIKAKSSKDAKKDKASRSKAGTDATKATGRRGKKT